jgi:hypothetical protein
VFAVVISCYLANQRCTQSEHDSPMASNHHPMPPIAVTCRPAISAASATIRYITLHSSEYDSDHESMSAARGKFHAFRNVVRHGHPTTRRASPLATTSLTCSPRRPAKLGSADISSEAWDLLSSQLRKSRQHGSRQAPWSQQVQRRHSVVCEVSTAARSAQ